MNPALQIIGVERERSRVPEVQGLELRQADFTTLPDLGPVRLLRVMNVLRGYREAELPATYEALRQTLAPGGLCLEGSADPAGALLTCHLLRRQGEALLDEGLLFFTDFSRGFAPLQFRDWLPRDLRRKVRAPAPIYDFFERWTARWQTARGPGALADVFARSADLPDVQLLAPGLLVWRRDLAPFLPGR